MKKRICLFVFCFLMTISVSSMAVEEITFQNLPWLSNIETSIKILKENGFLADSYEPIINHNKPVLCVEKDEELNTKPIELKEEGFVNHISLANGIQKKIAGYNVNDVLLTYLFDGDNTKLVSVQVELDGISFADLENKLERVYGTGMKITNDEGITTITWQGDENSCVMLYSVDEDYTILIYGRLDIDMLCKSIKAEQENTTNNKVDPNDISGL